MNFSWKLSKIFLASLLIIAALFLAVTQLRPSSYSGTPLSFNIGHGLITINNPSSEPVAVQILGTGTRVLRLTSTTEGLAGSSTRLGNGSSATQLLELMLPVGQTEFTIIGGTNASFASTSPVLLEASVQGLSEIEARATMIVAGLVVLGALFYISRSMEHRWLSMLRGQVAVPVVATLAKPVESAQGTPARSYGDNRK
jgi:hypothetical protein